MNPTTATTSPRTSPTRRSACCRTSSRRRRASRSSRGSRPVRCTRRTRSPPSGSSRTSGSSTTVGTRGASALFARQVASGIVPAGTELTPRPPWVAAWDALPPEEQRLYARMMEVFAGFLTHTDHQIGRVVDYLRANDLLDDTLICLLSDNGTSAEGGPYGSVNEHRFVHGLDEDLDENLARIDELGGFRAYNHYAWGWAWAGNTPLRLWKRYTWLGGVRTPLIVHWPARHRGARRGARAVLPRGRPHADDPRRGRHRPRRDVDGVDQHADRREVVARRRSPTRRRPRPATSQYFEMLGSRAIYHDGWKATTDHVGGQLAVEREHIEGSRVFDEDNWLLFDLAARLLRVARPRGRAARAAAAADRPVVVRGRAQPRAAARRLLHRPRRRDVSDRRTARGSAPCSSRAARPCPRTSCRRSAPGTSSPRASTSTQRANGILFALGNWTNGCALLPARRPSRARVQRLRQRAPHRRDEPVPAGAHELVVSRTRARAAAAPASSRSTVAKSAAASSRTTSRSAGRSAAPGLTIGDDRGFPVCDDYEPPFPFTGTLHDVTFEIPMLAPEGRHRRARRARHRAQGRMITSCLWSDLPLSSGAFGAWGSPQLLRRPWSDLPLSSGAFGSDRRSSTQWRLWSSRSPQLLRRPWSDLPLSSGAFGTWGSPQLLRGARLPTDRGAAGYAPATMRRRRSFMRAMRHAPSSRRVLLLVVAVAGLHAPVGELAAGRTSR